MTVATITTDINIGPFKIPSNGQNMIMKIETIILCSIHQLPKKDEDFIKLKENLKNIEFHFALEGLSGKGTEFLDHCKKEAKSFDDAEHLSNDYSWSDLYKQINK